MQAHRPLSTQAMEPTVPGPLKSLIVFGMTLESALKMPEVAEVRDVDVVELRCQGKWTRWKSGKGSIVKAASAAGYMAFDVEMFKRPGVTDQEGRDLFMRWGFLSAVRWLLAIRKGGLLWMSFLPR